MKSELQKTEHEKSNLHKEDVSHWSVQNRTVHARRQRTPGAGHVSRSTCRRRGCRSTGSHAGIAPGCCCCRCRSSRAHCVSPA